VPSFRAPDKLPTRKLTAGSPPQGIDGKRSLRVDGRNNRNPPSERARPVVFRRSANRLPSAQMR